MKKHSTINVSGCSANWVSGARKSYPSNLKVFPQGETIISVDRSSGDGYAQDAEFALKVQSMRYQKRQAEATEESAQANRNAAYAASRAANAAQNRVFQERNRAFQERINNLLRY